MESFGNISIILETFGIDIRITGRTTKGGVGMFELFKRLKTVLASELHTLIDKAEDPVSMVDHYLREMEYEMKELERSAASMMAEEKLLHKKLADIGGSIKRREEQALEALKMEREELARRALEDKANLNKESEHLSSLHDTASRRRTELVNKLSVMRKEFRELERKRESLKARAQSAKVLSSLHSKSLDSGGSADPKKGFERMEQKVLRYEAEAEAAGELNESYKSLDQEFAELKADNEVEQELLKLKQQLNKEDEQTG